MIYDLTTFHLCITLARKTTHIPLERTDHEFRLAGVPHRSFPPQGRHHRRSPPHAPDGGERVTAGRQHSRYTAKNSTHRWQ